MSAGSAAAGLMLPSASIPSGSTEVGGLYQIDTSTGGLLIAEVDPQGTATSLALLDSGGHELVESDGESRGEAGDVIDEHIPAGTYFLRVEGSGGTMYSLTATLMLAAQPFGTIAVGSSPYDVVTGDFNGDGILDLAVANSYSNETELGSTPSGTVSILLGTGDGTFRPPVNYPAGQEPFALAAGDFDGDGITDLAVADAGNGLYGVGDPGSVDVLLGNGDGTFRPQATADPVVGLSATDSLVAHDFNGDGRADLAVSTYFGVAILLSNGDGTFLAPTTYPVGFDPQFVAGDFNNDGRTDLAVLAESSDGQVALSVLLGEGDGTFQPGASSAVGPGASALVADDFNGDGKLDVAVAGSSTLSVLPGNGDGTFRSEGTTYPVVFGGISLVAGDFNGDGRADLVAGTSVLLGNGDGTFRVAQESGPAAGAGVAGDFNGDGITDLATVDYASNVLSVSLSRGDGNFGSQFTYYVGAGPRAMVDGDFNGDGITDLAVANNFANDISVLLGNGDGTFEPQETYALESAPTAIVAGDFNGDGRTDLAVATYDGVSILLGNGDGTFQPAVNDAAGTFPTAIVAGDFNGDGILDLAEVDSGGVSYGVDPAGEVDLLLGNGDGTFRPAVMYAAGSNPRAIVTGDFNGDGITDLALADEGDEGDGGTDPGGLGVLLGNGDGTFRSPVIEVAGFDPDALATGDFDGDGITDIAVADGGKYGNGALSVFLGRGDGTFGPSSTYAVGGYGPDAIVAGDFNGDGRTDLALADAGQPYIASDASQVMVLLGHGDGTFETEAAYPVGNQPTSLVAGDLNGDGRIDLATTDNGAESVSVLLGDGDGTFGDNSPLALAARATPLMADVNRDGTDDVLVVDGTGDILYRQGIPGHPGTFMPPVIVNPSDPARDIAWVPATTDGPLLASVDVRDDAVLLWKFYDGGFIPLVSLATGPLPAQIIAADLDGNGWDDLVVRNAGDGSLSVFFNSGPRGLPPGSVPFETPLILPVGVGVSDVQAIDTTGSGLLDLVIANKTTGQVGVLYNLGGGSFATAAFLRAGTGLSEADPDVTPNMTSQEETAGVAAGSFTAGGPPDLVTINPGSDTLDVLAGLGVGRFANPVAIQAASPPQVVRVGDFNGDGVPDLAILSAGEVSVYLGDGAGGFRPPTSDAVNPESDGLTVADVNHDGRLDLLVGDPYGDILVLLGAGDGTFQPYRRADQAVELAVADLGGDGSKDIIYADQGLDRVVVAYGAGSSTVVADQSTGLLQPGAVQLADLNGDGIPDLIVANSGSNNVLIFPGLGNGQFGPAVNDGHGYFVGDNPVGITVADLTGSLPDLVVADEGSNQVSVLLNRSQQGGVISFAAGERLNSGGSGPVSTIVGNFAGGAFPDLLVTNSQSNNVVLLPGVGQGFFNDQDSRTYVVSSGPMASFVGNFDGQADLVTVNAGSNSLTIISGFEGPNLVVSTIPSGGVDPTTAFDFSTGTGFEDLVVGNTGDGALALFEGGPEGLSLASVESEPNVPDPTALAFSALTGGQVQFYAATEGRESAELVALSLSAQLDPGTGTGGESPGSPPSATPSGTAAESSSGSSGSLSLTGTFVASPSASSSVQLVALNDATLPLVATVLTLTLETTGAELGTASMEGEAAAAVAAVGPGTTAGQGPASTAGGGGSANGPTEDADDPAAAARASAMLAPWESFLLGLDEALEELGREGAGNFLERLGPPDQPAPPPPASPPSPRNGADPPPVPQPPAEVERLEREIPPPPEQDRVIETAIARPDADPADIDAEPTRRPPTDHGAIRRSVAYTCLAISVFAGRSEALGWGNPNRGQASRRLGDPVRRRMYVIF